MIVASGIAMLFGAKPLSEAAARVVDFRAGYEGYLASQTPALAAA